MPESMFGRPLQHLLPSQPQISAEGSSEASNPLTPPVPLAPLPFKDFRFSSIGKQPELLSRISHPQPDSADYHSPTPSPLSISPAFIGDFPKTASRPTLFQQLAGSDSGWHASTSHPDGSLASRIQMSGSPSNSIANAAHGTASRLPSPPMRISTVRREIEDANLIPPVEVLPQPPGSSPTTPASWAPPLDQGDFHTPALSTPLINTTAITTSQIATPSVVITNIASREQTEPSSSAVVDATMQDLQPSLSATIDLLSRQERLQAISAKLANLASPLHPPSSQSPPPDLSFVTRANINIIPDHPDQSQPSHTPIVLHYPYPTNQSSGEVRLCADDAQTHTNASSLALVPSPTTLAQEYHARSKAIVAAIQNLNSVLSAAQRAQLDSENDFALRTRAFEEQRTAFEQTKRAEEATLQRDFQELRKKREELNAKEALLASLEKENKAREEARKGILAKRQAQEEEKRVAEAKRVQGVQEQITSAMDELKEFGALKAKCQVLQLADETLTDDLPTEPREGGSEEETAVIKSRNDLLCAVKHLRRMHTDKVQKLEETNRTLLRLGEERKKREAEEAERRRIAEERLRALAEMERAHQLLDEKRRQVEAERNRQEVEKDREQARFLVEQQAHAEAQANPLGRVHATNSQTFEHPSRPDQVDASQNQGITDVSRIRMPHKENPFSPETVNAMNVDEDGRDAPNRTAPSSDIHTSPCAPQSKQKKKDKPVSGGVMLAAATLKASGGHLPPKPLAISPSASSPVHMDAPKTPRLSPAVSLPPNGGHSASLPAQPTSGSIRTVNAESRPTPSAFSRTPKSQTILEATSGASQELNINIGPLAGVSPTQRNVNLRHLKRFRGRVEGNDSGDRSVRTVSQKSEENSSVSVKKEAHEEIVPASLSTNPPASLPPRPAIIPPPRPRMFRKRSEAPAAQTNSSNSYPPKSNELSLTRRGAEITANERPKEAALGDTPSSQAMNVPVQPPAPANSLLLGPVYTESQAQESRINAGERPTWNCGENGDTTPSEPVSATPSHEMDGEDPSKNNRRFAEEHRRARNANGSRRMADHYSPPSVTSRPLVTPPTQSHRPIDSWRPQNSSNGPRAEPMRATSPTTGRKRPSEYTDNEYGHRARRQRGDVWVAQDHDRDRADSHRLHRDRRLDSESDERRAAYRAPGSPVDRTRPYPLDTSRTNYDNRTYTSEESTSPVARWEQSYGRTEGDDTYHRYQPSAPVYNAMADQHYTDNRLGQAYEPMTVESMDTQPELLARIHDTQRFPPRGRGRGEPSRGRGDSGRGRGRGVARGGTPLLDRLTSGPSSLENRLT